MRVPVATTSAPLAARMPSRRASARAVSSGAGRNTLVDLRPWQTAQSLAALAVTAEETEYARAAERNADHYPDGHG